MNMLGYNFNLKFSILTFILIVHFFYNPVDSGAVQLTQNNLEGILTSNELVLINFYADWCRFSNILMPIFDEAADKISKDIPEAGRVVLGKVDCDREASIASRYRITKYPTIKVIRNGQAAKKEYRAQRSINAFSSFVKDQLVDPIKEFQSISELVKLEYNKRFIIGYYDKKDQQEYDVFRRAATNLKDDCEFLVGFEEASRQMHPPGQPVVVFRPDQDRSNDMEETFTGDINNFNELHSWIQEKCVPTVREITFENAEELTEEGLPFLILFHHSDDKDSIKKYTDVVKSELIDEKQSINFLTADGKKFSHPLHHLDKTESDLPLIAIDSFRHMYLFPDFKEMETPGRMKQFILDLYSGKLHREFHYGPDDPQEAEKETHIIKRFPTTPPESTFKKLAPSKNRYTLLKDEL